MWVKFDAEGTWVVTGKGRWFRVKGRGVGYGRRLRIRVGMKARVGG